MPGSVKHPNYYCKGIVKIPGPPVLIHTGSLSSSPPPSYLQQAKNSVLRFRKSYEAAVHLDLECLQEVQWWKDNLVAWNGKALFEQSTDLVIETDAARQGWGAYCQGMSTGGRWLPEETSYHINCLELLAGSLALMSFTKNKAKAQSGTIADGQHFSSNLHEQNWRDRLPKAILPSQMSMGLVPHPQYLGDSALPPRNTECRSGQGIESIFRFQQLETSSRVFDRLYQMWGPLNIDLFASRLSYQLDQFVSWRPDPLAIHTDAFTLDWATFRGYAFPPFALIG